MQGYTEGAARDREVLLEQHPPDFDAVLFNVDLPQIVYDYIYIHAYMYPYMVI